MADGGEGTTLKPARHLALAVTPALLSVLGRSARGDAVAGAGADAPRDTGRQGMPLLSEPRLRVWWEEGLSFDVGREHLLGARDETQTSPAIVEGRVDLRLDVDGAAFAGGQGLGAFDDNVVLRRLQIAMAGEVRLGTPIQYYFRFSLLEDSLLLEDDHLALRPGIPADRVRVGQFKPPQSLENLTPSHGTVFMALRGR